LRSLDRLAQLARRDHDDPARCWDRDPAGLTAAAVANLGLTGQVVRAH
jgi:hypothetical protein